MGPGGRFYCFDNAPQDGVSAGATEVANCCCHPASNTRPRHSPGLQLAIHQWKKMIHAGQ